MTASPLRDLLARLDSTDAARALGEGWYVTPPRGVGGAALARHLDVDPTAKLLLLGAIGTGKTTALLVARDALSTEDSVIQYIDAPLYDDMERPRPGLLLRLAGLTTLRQRRSEGPLNALERGAAELIHTGLSPDDDAELVDLALMDAARGLPSAGVRDLEAAVGHLGANVRGWASRRRVLLVDGIDLTDEGASLDLLIDDLGALRRLGFGVCIAGSVGWRYTLSPELLARFDRLIAWPPPAPEVDANDRDFLREVLVRRVGASAFAPALLDQIVLSSGGVMRDLLDIARRAVLEALLDECPALAPEHVLRAVAELGRERQLALDTAALDVARRFLDQDDVMVRGDRIADLLRRAVLLPVDPNQQRFRVHPALAPLLRAREAA